MKVYTIPEALAFLAKEYGANRMPTSQETLRRAVRTGDLLVQEDGDPGRKGYTISEDDLRVYARNRLARMERRSTIPPKASGNYAGGSQEVLPKAVDEQNTKQFHELYSQLLSGEMDEQTYFLALYREKSKWETNLRSKKEQLINLTSIVESLKNEILECEANIADFQEGINKAVF